MVLALPILVGVALALACGGRLGGLATMKLRRVELFYAAIAIQIVAFPAAFLPWEMSDGVARALWLASYGVLCAAALLNYRVLGVPIVAAGMISNVVAVLANGGHMPALPSALRGAGEAPGVHFNSAEMATPNLSWLVDRWAAPGWLPWANVFSVGDIVIALGVVVIVFAASGPFARFRNPQEQIPEPRKSLKRAASRPLFP